jgi:hypothetical protein
VLPLVLTRLLVSRTGSDLEATWGSVMKNLDQTAPLHSLAGVRDTGMGLAGHWNGAQPL